MLQDASANPIDGEPTAYAGTAVDASGVGTSTWEFSEAGGGTGPPSSGTAGPYAGNSIPKSGTSHYLQATNFGLPVPEGVTIRGVRFGLWGGANGENNVYDARIRLILGGVVKEAGAKASSTPWPAVANSTWRYYGAMDDLWNNTTLLQSDVVASNFGIAIALRNTSATFALAAFIWSVQVVVAYTESANENRVCFASRSLQLSDNGPRRQHVTDDVWGELIPDGLDIQAPVPGQADQPMRALIVPSVGDFEARADSATAKLTAKVYYRPGYLSAREAE